MKKFWLSGWTKALAFALCLIPLGRLLWRIYVNDLTANPVEFITHFTGDWTLRFLLITLAVTPVRGLLRQPQLIRFRRLLGLFAFFYGLLHLTTWIWLSSGFDVAAMWQDVVEKAVHHVGNDCVAADGSAGRDFDGQVGAAHRICALAAAAPARSI